MKSLLAKSILASLICLAFGSLSGLLTVNSITGWYLQIQKPTWNPPAWLFGPVWSTLYILMGIAFALIWHSNAVQKNKAMVYFGIQFILNLAWTPIFFYFHAIGLALFEILVLLAFIVTCIHQFYQIETKAAYLLIPYLLWVCFASYLTFTIWELNTL